MKFLFKVMIVHAYASTVWAFVSKSWVELVACIVILFLLALVHDEK